MRLRLILALCLSWHSVIAQVPGWENKLPNAKGFHSVSVITKLFNLPNTKDTSIDTSVYVLDAEGRTVEARSGIGSGITQTAIYSYVGDHLKEQRDLGMAVTLVPDYPDSTIYDESKVAGMRVFSYQDGRLVQKDEYLNGEDTSEKNNYYLFVYDSFGRLIREYSISIAGNSNTNSHLNRFGNPDSKTNQDSSIFAYSYTDSTIKKLFYFDQYYTGYSITKLNSEKKPISIIQKDRKNKLFQSEWYEYNSVGQVTQYKLQKWYNDPFGYFGFDKIEYKYDSKGKLISELGYQKERLRMIKQYRYIE